MTGAQVRAADALLRAVGGETVLLHIPAPAIPGDPGEQLGLATPLFQDAELGPALLRKVRARTGTFERERAAEYELLVSASAVERLAGSLEPQAAQIYFAQVSSVAVQGQTMEISAVTGAEAFGRVYLYRLGLRAPAASLV